MKQGAQALLTVGAVALTVLLTIYAQIILRWQMDGVTLPSEPMPLIWSLLGQIIANLWVASGLLALVLVIPLWMYVLRHMEVSTAFPFMSLAQVGVVVLGVALLDESLTLTRIAGVGLICAGVAMIGGQRS